MADDRVGCGVRSALSPPETRPLGVRRKGTLLRQRYAMSGAKKGYASTLRYAMSGTGTGLGYRIRNDWN